MGVGRKWPRASAEERPRASRSHGRGLEGERRFSARRCVICDESAAAASAARRLQTVPARLGEVVAAGRSRDVELVTLAVTPPPGRYGSGGPAAALRTRPDGGEVLVNDTLVGVTPLDLEVTSELEVVIRDPAPGARSSSPAASASPSPSAPPRRSPTQATRVTTRVRRSAQASSSAASSEARPNNLDAPFSFSEARTAPTIPEGGTVCSLRSEAQAEANGPGDAAGGFFG